MIDLNLTRTIIFVNQVGGLIRVLQMVITGPRNDMHFPILEVLIKPIFNQVVDLLCLILRLMWGPRRIEVCNLLYTVTLIYDDVFVNSLLFVMLCCVVLHRGNQQKVD